MWLLQTMKLMTWWYFCQGHTVTTRYSKVRDMPSVRWHWGLWLAIWCPLYLKIVILPHYLNTGTIKSLYIVCYYFFHFHSWNTVFTEKGINIINAFISPYRFDLVYFASHTKPAFDPTRFSSSQCELQMFCIIHGSIVLLLLIWGGGLS